MKKKRAGKIKNVKEIRANNGDSKQKNRNGKQIEQVENSKYVPGELLEKAIKNCQRNN